MAIINSLTRNWSFLGLIALMAATRFHHFGSVNFLPDASLAVFFLAGFYLPGRSGAVLTTETQAENYWFSSGWVLFSLLIIEAGLIDLVAIKYGGVSDWCVTPAYLFLIPTYAVMFIAGKMSVGYDPAEKWGVLKIAGVLCISTSLAFIVSNASFYLFSDRFADSMTWKGFVEGISSYYWSYLMYTLFYSGAVMAIVVIMQKTLQMAGIDKNAHT